MSKRARERARERRRQLDELEAEELLGNAHREVLLAKRWRGKGLDPRGLKMLQSSIDSKLDRAGALLGIEETARHRPIMERSVPAHSKVRYG